MAWSYQREESKGGGDTKIPEGKHRIRIHDAQKAVAKTGKDMLSLTFDVSGYNNKIFHNIVFLPDRPEITNRNLTRFFDAFKDIPEGEFDTAKWIGKVGAAEVKHEEYNGNKKAAIRYFISADRQDTLPPWKEPEGSGGAPVQEDANGFLKIPEGVDRDLPF